jgi:transcriptional regulator with XRE-family HTH domain
LQLNYSAEMINFDTFADRLAWARKRRGLSQQQLADLCGIAQSTLGSLEAGTRLTSRKVSSIAEILEVDVAWLAEGKGMPPGAEASTYQRPTKPAMVARRPSQMQWVSDEEAQLLSLYRSAADDRGRELIRLAADGVPKVVPVAIGEAKN